MIKETELYQSDPFQFCLFQGSLSSNKQGCMAPVLMVEVERENILSGLDYFCASFDGENPLSPCGHSFVFFTLYHNQLTVIERENIIQDNNHHIGDFDIVHLHSFQDLDGLITLKQNIKVKLRKLLLALCANQSTKRLFIQVENVADPESIVCALHSVDRDMVHANPPYISTYIRQGIIEEDLEKVFLYNDGNITAATKSIPIRAGNLQVNLKPVPSDVQERTECALHKTVIPAQKRSPRPSFSTVTASTPSTSAMSLSSLQRAKATPPTKIY